MQLEITPNITPELGYKRDWPTNRFSIAPMLDWTDF